MTKMILCCLLFFCMASGWAQTPQEKVFENKEKELNRKLQQALDQKDNKSGETICKELIRNFELQPENFKKKKTWFMPNYYYNLACFQSLLQKKEAAIESLNRAIEKGYQDYKHVLKDTDLNNLRKDKKFQEIVVKLKEVGDYLYILQKSDKYTKNLRTDTLPKFTYMNPNDSNLVQVRQYFKLDSVAGSGDEISKIKNILTYIHDKIMHDGQHGNPPTKNSISMAEACKDGSRGLNCRGLATVLNECYLAMGFKSRFVTCMPKIFINDCHVINAVYSNTLDKWLWVDPTNNAWVMDEKGTLLSIQEVRERLRDGRPLVLNKEANWNNRSKPTKETYLENYMSKNLYAIECTDRSEYDTESKEKERANYILLCPVGFSNEYPNNGGQSCQVYDDEWFWQSPYQK